MRSSLRYLLFALLSFSLVGCAEATEAEDKALWLCLNGHWIDPVPADFPDGIAPGAYIAARDLAFLKRSKRDSLLVQVVLTATQVDKVGLGWRQASAARSTCKVLSTHMAPSKDRLTLKVQRVEPDWNPDWSLQKYAKLATLQSAEQVADELKVWLDADKPPMKTVTHEMTFLRAQDRWVASFGLEEAHEAKRKDKEARRLIQDEVSRLERSKLALERELKQHLYDAENFDAVAAAKVKVMRTPTAEPGVTQLRFDVATHGILRGPFGDVVAKLRLGFESKDGAVIWEVIIPDKRFYEDRDLHVLTRAEGVEIPEDAIPFVRLVELKGEHHAHTKDSAEASRKEAAALKLKVEALDVELAKQREQLK